MRRTVLSIPAVSFFVALVVTGASAQESVTEWQNHQDMLQTRIIVASADMAASHPGQFGAQAAEKLVLAWEANLQDGWKTYWRSPGEAGLPVNVFVDGVKQDILYPFPERFELFGLETYGYSKHVAIPFEVPKSAQQLDISADFMVCKDICVPFKASYEIKVDPMTSGTIVTDTRINTALEDVPVRFGDVADGIEITSVRFAGKPGRQNLIVEASANMPLNKADLLAELNASTQFHAPKMRLLPDGRSARFVLPVMSTNKDLDLAGQTVRLTFTDGRGNALEQFFELPPR